MQNYTEQTSEQIYYNADGNGVLYIMVDDGDDNNADDDNVDDVMRSSFATDECTRIDDDDDETETKMSNTSQASTFHFAFALVRAESQVNTTDSMIMQNDSRNSGINSKHHQNNYNSIK